MLGKLQFKYLIGLFPAVTVLALAAISLATAMFAQQNGAHLERIESAYIPSLESSRNLEELLALVQRGLQDATYSEDLRKLDETDQLKDAFLLELRKLASYGLRDASQTQQLQSAFLTYYTVARATTKDLIKDAVGDNIVQRLEGMEARHSTAKRALADATKAERMHMLNAFDDAKATNAASLQTNAVTSLACLVVLGFLGMAVRGGIGRLVSGVVEGAARINTAAAEMSATARQHEQGAAEQASAVEETQATTVALLESGGQVTRSIDVVLQNAEQTQSKNQVIADSIVRLSAHTERIGESLDSIKDISNKTELLALNAAIEGTKAGEAGRGFSLVASQMQRLAENVMESVKGIKILTTDIRSATSVSVLATEEGSKLAADTTRSAREIRQIMQQHQVGTNQMSQAMVEVAEVGQQAAAGSRQVLESSVDLTDLSHDLLSLIERFRISDDVASEKA